MGESRRLPAPGAPPAADAPEAGPEPALKELMLGWERSAALGAAPAPMEGPLLPNETGHLVAVGPPAQRLYPRLARWVRWSPFATAPAVLMLPFLVAPTPYGPLGAGLIAALATWLPRAGLRTLGAVRLDAHLDAAAPVSSWRLAPPGQPVRLRGRVMEQSTVPALFSRRATVLARSEYAGVSETRGIDFRIEMEDGEVLHVSPRDALLLGDPQRLAGDPACGPLALRFDGDEPRLGSALLSVQSLFGRLLRLPTRELLLAPGDEVELCGTVIREPATDGEPSLGRAPPLRTRLGPAGEIPVLARKR